MSLSSLQLDAFAEVVRTRNFSRAAKNLRITQSALSQRIRNLEDELGTAVLVRDRAGARPTPTGEAVLRYCQAREGLELELVGHVRQRQDQVEGVVRVAGYSSIVRSAVMPALSPLVRAHPRLQLGLFSRELTELPGVLTRGEADFVLLDRELDRAGIIAERAGFEDYVLIEPVRGQAPAEVFLDHDVDDTITEEFFKAQGSARKRLPSPYRRRYLDENYALLDGVVLGWGRAVVPRHLALADSRVRIAATWKPLRTPVYLHSIQQAFHPKLHHAVRAALLKGLTQALS